MRKAPTKVIVILIVFSLALVSISGLVRRMAIGEFAVDVFRLAEITSGSASGIRRRAFGTGLVLANVVVVVVVVVVVAAVAVVVIVVFVIPLRCNDVIENFLVTENFFLGACSAVDTFNDPSGWAWDVGDGWSGSGRRRTSDANILDLTNAAHIKNWSSFLSIHFLEMHLREGPFKATPSMKGFL